MRSRLVAVLVSALGCATPDTLVSAPVPDAGPVVRPAPRVLLYTKETEWVHPSNPVATARLQQRGAARGWAVTTSNDSAVFSERSLAGFDVVVFVLTSGMTLDPAQRDAFAEYIATGHGWVGAHSASHTDYDWPFMRAVVGTSFCCHPPIMPAELVVEDATDPLVAHLPRRWAHTDEWYTFDQRPEENPRLKVLLALDERSAHPHYPGPDQAPSMAVGYHPVTWRQQLGATRSFYTALGHTVEAWDEAPFVAMVEKAIEWAAGASSGTAP